jgi:hypothetical protein
MQHTKRHPNHHPTTTPDSFRHLPPNRRARHSTCFKTISSPPVGPKLKYLNALSTADCNALSLFRCVKRCIYVGTYTRGSRASLCKRLQTGVRTFVHVQSERTPIAHKICVCNVCKFLMRIPAFVCLEHAELIHPP